MGTRRLPLEIDGVIVARRISRVKGTGSIPALFILESPPGVFVSLGAKIHDCLMVWYRLG